MRKPLLAEDTLGACGITANKNMIPFDERKPMDPSGIRLGTPALTTRGMGVEQMKEIGGWIVESLSNPEDKALLEKIHGQVKESTLPRARSRHECLNREHLSHGASDFGKWHSRAPELWRAQLRRHL